MSFSILPWTEALRETCSWSSNSYSGTALLASTAARCSPWTIVKCPDNSSRPTNFCKLIILHNSCSFRWFFTDIAKFSRLMSFFHSLLRFVVSNLVVCPKYGFNVFEETHTSILKAYILWWEWRRVFRPVQPHYWPRTRRSLDHQSLAFLSSKLCQNPSRNAVGVVAVHFSVPIEFVAVAWKDITVIMPQQLSN